MSIALITGCSSGFGLEAALEFARRGHTPIATMRNLDKAGSLRERAEAEGLTLDLQTLDVTDDESVAACIADVLDRHGRLDVLVNNAGIGAHGAVETIPMEDFRALIETNFWGPVRMIRAVLPHLRSQRSGAIVNVGSIAGVVPGTPYNGPYGSSKHALGALSESVQNEVEPFGVRVVCIEPRFYSTEINANSAGRHGQGGITATEYEADYVWFDSFMNSGVEEGADPAIVAARIVDAAEQPTPLHQPVGDDAELYVALLKEAATFEQWMDVAMPIVEAQAGPRPAPPARS